MAARTAARVVATTDGRVNPRRPRHLGVFFPTHLLVAVLIGRGRFPTVWVVFGAALPDVVDKPLAMAGVVQTYHTVVHSALFGAVFAVALVLAWSTERGPSVGVVVATLVGWGSHLGADALHITLNGRPENTVFLIWPVVETWDSIDAGPGPFILQYAGTTSFYLEVVIWVCAGYLLFRDGPAVGVLDRS